jgi:hypothetical protein
MRLRLLIPAALAASLAVAPSAHANVLSRLYAPLHIHPRSAPSPTFIRSHFDTITVQSKMLRKYRARHVGIYTKGTRSNDGNFPSSWYLHTASGARIHDRARSKYFVMNPGSAGWRKHVVQNCKPAPNLCFLDAMGDDGYSRTSGRPSISLSTWRSRVTALANYVENASDRYHVIANNLITVTHPKFRVAYEMFARTSAARSLDVLRRTTCICFAKLGTEQGARYGFTLFLAGAGKGDRISVGTDAQAGKWWDFFNKAGSLGRAVADAKTSGGLITRRYSHGYILVNTGRTAARFSRSGISKTVGARDGMIVINN